MLIVEKRLVEEEPAPEGTTEASGAEPSPKGTAETPESKPANLKDIQEFEKTFINKFYNQKDKKGAINYLNDYINNRGTIRKEFVSVRYNDIYKVSDETARSTVVKYLRDNLGSAGENLAKTLENKNPKFVNDFVQGMSFECLSDPNNLFINLFNNGYENLLKNENNFSKAFNICSAFQNKQEEFNKYSATGDCILRNDKLYVINSNSDLNSLVEYDMGLVEKSQERTALNDAIAKGRWKSYVLNQANKNKEAEREKGGSKKPPKQLADEFYNEIKKKNPNDAKEIFTNLFKSIGLKDPETISNSMVNAIFPK